MIMHQYCVDCHTDRSINNIVVTTTTMFGDAIKRLLEQEDATSLLLGSLLDGTDLPTEFKDEFNNEFANIEVIVNLILIRRLIQTTYHHQK